MYYYRKIDKTKLNITELRIPSNDDTKYNRDSLGVQYVYKRGKHNVEASIMYITSNNKKYICIQIHILNQDVITIYSGQVDVTSFDIEMMKKEIKDDLLKSYNIERVIFPEIAIKSNNKKIYEEYIKNAINAKEILQLYFGI